MHHEQLDADDSAPLTLRDLGWNDVFAQAFAAHAASGDIAARVITVHRNRVVVRDATGEKPATLAPALRDADVGSRPATGDWVVLRPGEAGGDAQVRAVLTRQSAFTRRAAGEKAVPQVVAANVDRIFIVTALPDDVNVRRLERYLAVAWESGALPVVLLTKADQVENVDEWLAMVRGSAPGVDVVAISTVTGAGLAELDALLTPASTIALLGSSGVGKSTLVNHLAGRTLMRTAGVRDDGRGRHTTTHRELVRLPNGVLVIDTPGMRELQLWSGTAGLEQAFDDITALSADCRFADCAHRAEPGCAVMQAMDAGLLDAERLASWRKLSREVARIELMNDAVAASAERAKLRSLMRSVRVRLREKNE